MLKGCGTVDVRTPLEFGEVCVEIAQWRSRCTALVEAALAVRKLLYEDTTQRRLLVEVGENADPQFITGAKQ